MDHIKQAAIDYIGRGWAVFPVHGIVNGVCTCGNTEAHSIGKHPLTKAGFKDAIKDLTQIDTLFKRKNSNIAIATGRVSGIFVVDIDSDEAEQLLDQWQAEHGEMPLTLQVQTQKGRHIYFKYPSFTEIGSNSGRIAGKIDLRGDGGYVVAPPSARLTGEYEWIDNEATMPAEAPAWLLYKIIEVTKKPEPVRTSSEIVASWNDDEVYKMLQVLSPDCDYDTWYKIGMALQASGRDESMWNDWSSYGSKYKGAKDISLHWKSFHQDGRITLGTLVYMALKAGYEPPKRMAAKARMQAETALENEVKTALPAPAIPQEATKHNGMPYIGGLIGETVKWITETAILPQPELALMNTLAALGGIFGRRYKSPLNTRPNVFMVGIAGSGSGKDHSRHRLKQLMGLAGLDQYIGSDHIVSGQGIITSMCKRPSQIMMIDEFGMMMEAMTDPKGQNYLKAAAKMITILYSSSGSSYMAGQYADAKEQEKNLFEPALSIYGTSTLEKYIGSLKRSNIESGEVNRFLIYKPENDPEIGDDPEYGPPPPRLVQMWKAFKPVHGFTTKEIENPAMDVITVKWNDEVAEFLKQEMRRVLDLQRNSSSGPVWVRYRENMIKVAMIAAIAENHDKPFATMQHFNFAKAFVDRCMQFILRMVNEHMYENDHHKNMQDVLAVIREERQIKHTKLKNRFRQLRSTQLKEIVDSLFEQGDIDIQEATKPMRGPAPTVYVFIDKQDD